MVGQFAMIHHLQQDVEQVGMRLLDLVKQQHGMRLLVDGVGEQPALIKADVAGRGADQPEMLCRSIYSDMSKQIRSIPST